MPNPSIDPVGQRYGLHGRVVTMNAAFAIIDPGTVFIDAGRIVAALPDDAPVPPGSRMRRSSERAERSIRA